MKTIFTLGLNFLLLQQRDRLRKVSFLLFKGRMFFRFLNKKSL